MVSAGSYGIYVADSSSPTFTNCVVRNSGYGVYAQHTSPGRTLTLTNCTLHGNSFGVLTSAGTGNGATVAITNSIITNGSYGVYRSDGASISVTYSDVWNNSSGNFMGGAAPGAGVLSANPQFVSTTNLRLQPASVAIDSGTTGRRATPTA